MYKIDVKHQVEEMERVLRTQDDSARCRNSITILRRWQFDEMLDDASREKARMLVLEFDLGLPVAANAEAVATHWPAGTQPENLPYKTR